MFTIAQKKDGFRLLMPKEFIPQEIEEKYTKILSEAHSFYYKPIDFLNETIQKVEVLGINSATVAQQQTNKGIPLRDPNRIQQNAMFGGAADVNYRSAGNPLSLVDHTLNIDFRHTTGYLNYFLLLESFYYQYARDTKYIRPLDYQFIVDITSANGGVYSRIRLNHPIIDGMDMLTLDYTQPNATSSTFRVIFKYSNFDYEFININPNTLFNENNPFETEIKASKDAKLKEDQSYKNYDYSKGKLSNVITISSSN